MGLVEEKMLTCDLRAVSSKRRQPGKIGKEKRPSRSEVFSHHPCLVRWLKIGDNWSIS